LTQDGRLVACKSSEDFICCDIKLFEQLIAASQEYCPFEQEQLVGFANIAVFFVTLIVVALLAALALRLV
jgi:hypothetical protein